MARIVAGIGSSHVPAIGAAIDNGKTEEPYWKRVFSGFEHSQEWMRETKPDVAIIVYNDHASAFSVDLIPTFALGCAAEAGLPLTLRSKATRLCLVTAHLAADAQATDWSGVADSRTTVVVYMGLAAATAVRDGLIAAGRDPCTPVAVLARGTRPDAASVAGRLDALEALAAQVGEGPALIVVGDVVAHSDPWLAALAAHAPREIAA